MRPTPISEIDEELVAFNRERYKSELAQGIYDAMRASRVNRSQLAELLGVHKSRISHVLSGGKNLGAEVLADILLVLGRTPHLVMGTDLDSIRFPVDEGAKPSGANNVVRTAVGIPVLVTVVTSTGPHEVGYGFPSGSRGTTTSMGGQHEHYAPGGHTDSNAAFLCDSASR